MTNLDQFESLFNAAAHEAFGYRPLEVDSVLVVTDLDHDEAHSFMAHCQKLLSVLGDDVAWSVVHREQYTDCDQLLEMMDNRKPDLVVSYRNLKSMAYKWPYSLGVFLNVLIRQLEPPVIVLPHPKLDDRYAWAEINTDRVLVVTDHLTGDADLVNWGVKFTEPKGKLFLAHVESDADFARYMSIIGKLPDIPTELAREHIGERLLKDPAGYIEAVQQELTREGLDIDVEPIVKMGHKVSEYQALVEENSCDLVVFRTREPGNTEALALHGVAYALALELRRVPLLML